MRGRRIAAATVVTMLIAFGYAVRGQMRAADALYDGTASKLLRRNFSSPEISYLLLDVRTGSLIAQQWDASNEPVPIGSLAKPFTAIAFAESHNFRFPAHICTAGSCWLPRGHGRVDLIRATALSCNSYFTRIASKVNVADVAVVARRFGLQGPGVSASAETLIGMHGTWRESPEAVLRAYAELIGRRSQPAIREVAQGMAGAAKYGTASGIAKAAPRLAVLAKTGTAPCTHTQRAPGDGFVVVAWPADTPRYVLLVRRHGQPGAQAAALAGRMLRILEPGR